MTPQAGAVEYARLQGGGWRRETTAGGLAARRQIARGGALCRWSGMGTRARIISRMSPNFPCTFQNCKYDVNENNTWPDAGLTDGDMYKDDPAEFDYTRVSGTQFDIWDKDPL